MVCDCGYAFDAQGSAWVQKESDKRGVPDVRGPGFFAKLGACVVGYIACFCETCAPPDGGTMTNDGAAD